MESSRGGDSKDRGNEVVIGANKKGDPEDRGGVISSSADAKCSTGRDIDLSAGALDGDDDAGVASKPPAIGGEKDSLHHQRRVAKRCEISLDGGGDYNNSSSSSHIEGSWGGAAQENDDEQKNGESFSCLSGAELSDGDGGGGLDRSSFHGDSESHDEGNYDDVGVPSLRLAVEGKIKVDAESDRQSLAGFLGGLLGDDGDGGSSNNDDHQGLDGDDDKEESDDVLLYEGIVGKSEGAESPGVVVRHGKIPGDNRQGDKLQGNSIKGDISHEDTLRRDCNDGVDEKRFARPHSGGLRGEPSEGKENLELEPEENEPIYAQQRVPKSRVPLGDCHPPDGEAGRPIPSSPKHVSVKDRVDSNDVDHDQDRLSDGAPPAAAAVDVADEYGSDFEIIRSDQQEDVVTGSEGSFLWGDHDSPGDVVGDGGGSGDKGSGNGDTNESSRGTVDGGKAPSVVACEQSPGAVKQSVVADEYGDDFEDFNSDKRSSRSQETAEFDEDDFEPESDTTRSVDDD
ncbi:unnamed protein product [Sphacelaria rigidula]